MYTSLMKTLPKPVAFDWNGGNINKNLERHNVTDREAEEVFANEPKFILEDESHSETEKRYMLWGITGGGRKLTLIFTIRRNRVRIISARGMSRKERKFYEEASQTNSKI